jgi:hypothetical protein
VSTIKDALKDRIANLALKDLLHFMEHDYERSVRNCGEVEQLLNGTIIRRIHQIK